MDKKICAHIFVSGIVQGVFFRANTKEKAKELNLKGWVKNLPDGRVEILAEGDEEKIQKLIDWCWKGPELAKVEDVIVSYKKFSGKFEDFEILR
ncbi:MAG: acylphosphatase [Candidatus Altiarchaeota archaeon]